MSYELGLSPDGAVVVVTFNEDVTPELALASALAAQEFADGHGTDRLLIDVRGHSFAGSATDTYDFAHRTLPGAQISRARRVAVVASPGDDSHDFLGAVAQYAGYRVRVFKDQGEAEGWLRTNID